MLQANLDQADDCAGSFCKKFVAADWNHLTARDVAGTLARGFGGFNIFLDMTIREKPNMFGFPHELHFQLYMPHPDDRSRVGWCVFASQLRWHPQSAKMVFSQINTFDHSNRIYSRRGIFSRFHANRLDLLEKLGSREAWLLAGDHVGPVHWIKVGALPTEMPPHAASLFGMDASKYASWRQLCGNVQFMLSYPGDRPLRALTLAARKDVAALFDPEDPHKILRLPALSARIPVPGTTLIDAVLGKSSLPPRQGMAMFETDRRVPPGYVAVIRTDDRVQMKHMQDYLARHPLDPSLIQEVSAAARPGTGPGGAANSGGIGGGPV